MKPERQLLGWVLALCLGLFVLVGVQAWLFYANNVNDLGALPPTLRAHLVVFLGMALVSLLPFLVWGMSVWFRRYVLPLHRLTEDVEALLYGSPQARLPDDVDAPTGLRVLLNALMERYQHGEQEVQERLDTALGELSAEKTRLESLLDALGEGVVVFDEDGQIVRHNRAARTLFEGRPELGVGKPVAALVEQDVLTYARERLREQLATGVRHPHVNFQCRRRAAAPLRARIAPLLVYGGRLEGFILTLDPPDGPAITSAPAPRAQALAGPPPDPSLAEWNGRPLAELRFVVFDTETTGLRPAQGDAVISIGAVVVAGGQVVPGEQFDARVDPGRPITPAAQRVHGIRAEELAGKPTLDTVLPDFTRFAQGAVLVGHNAAFDLAFLRPAAEAAGLRFDQPVLDTMLLSAAVHPNQPSHSLDSLLARYGIAPHGRHTALGDAIMTAELLLRLLPQLERRHIATLGEALEASRRTPLARLSYGR